MSEESKSESGTITINKASLWKYSTFILVAVLIVGAFIFFGHNNGTGNAANTGATAQTTTTGPVDVSGFTADSTLYPSLGPSTASATVIEFADFQCPYCALASGQASWASQYTQYADLVNSAGKA